MDVVQQGVECRHKLNLKVHCNSKSLNVKLSFQRFRPVFQ